MIFKPIKTRKIYEEIVEQIKELITEGNLNPGDKLLSERELSEKLRVSRASVREALSALEIMGLVEVKPGEGTYIRQTSMDSLIHPLALVLMMERDTVYDLLEVRKILEVGIAGLAAERATEEQLQAMEEALEQMEQDIEKNDLGEGADIKFHYALAEAAANSLLLRLMNTISDSMRKSVHLSRLTLYDTPGTSQRLLDEHRGIYAAIKARDADGARRIMYEHLAGVEQKLAESERKGS